jgi:ABC-type polysaccharide/polyol phosphate transport system ATPase subunit
MAWAQLHSRHAGLAEDVVISVQGLSKAEPRPAPQPPRWLARVLPGVQWSAAAEQLGDDEDDDDVEDDDFLPRRKGALKEVSFELGPGEGLGLIGDQAAAKTVLSLLAGLYPPSTGRVVVRGRIAPLLRYSELNFSGYTGKSALKVISAFLGWPSNFLRNRWGDITAFAHLEEVEGFGYPPDSLEYSEACTKRLVLSAVMHLDATVYAVLKSFAGADTAMYERCCEVLDQRQLEGCAIIQMGRVPDDVARFCGEAILFEDGAPVVRDRLAAIAAGIEERRAAAAMTKELVSNIPMRVILVGGRTVTLGPDGGRIELEVDVFRHKVALLRLRFSDESGRQTELEYPEDFTAEVGVYRITVILPPALLDDGTYTATFLGGSVRERRAAEAAAAGETTEEADPRPLPPPVELLSFNVNVESGDTADPRPEFGVIGDDADHASSQEVEWKVRRVEI